MTLTEASYFTRRFAPFVVILILVFLIFFYAFKLLLLLGQAQPTKPTNTAQVVTDPKFGQIPLPQLPEATPSAQAQFILDTLDGTPNFPNATTAAQVYFLPQEPSRFGFLQRIYFMAQNAGFDTEQIKHQLQEKTAIFGDGKRRLTIDITNYNFSYKYTLTKDDTFVETAQVPADPKFIEQKAIDYLRTIDRYPAELAQGKPNSTYLYFNPLTTELATVANAADANMVEVDFFRPDVNGYPVVSPNYYHSPHYVVMVFNGNDVRVVRAQVQLFARSTDQIGSYPIKTPDEAWQQLQAGKGYIVAGDIQANPQVKIKKVMLAYLDPAQYEEYMQPVYVFLADNNVITYVPALIDEYFIDPAKQEE